MNISTKFIFMKFYLECAYSPIKDDKGNYTFVILTTAQK